VDEDGIGFEIVAASLRADSSDMSAFLPALAAKLEGALPQQTSVRYHGGLLSKKKSVQAIDVDLGDERFHIEEQHGRLEARRQTAVRGIVLKNEVLAVDAWIDDLSARLADVAQASETGRTALKQMLEDR
jgi:hypothetical protein